MKIKVIKHVLQANDEIAQKNRDKLTGAGVLGVNFISSPGSGKTTLLENTIPALEPEKVSVVVGDLQTARDAERVADMTVESVQINTGLSCHLYANQIESALEDIDLEKSDYLFIENVGNMVCPGEFDLGENIKVVLYSLPEGDDKVAKYPTIFRVADVILLTKCDLKGLVDFDMNRIKEDLAKLGATAPLLEISSKTGENFDKWISWLKEQKGKKVGKKAKFITE
jgi:hydrogenase nickel incorporation protein HypB